MLRLLRQQFFLFYAVRFVRFAKDSAVETVRDALAVAVALLGLVWKREENSEASLMYDNAHSTKCEENF